MIEITKTEVHGWEAAIRGMRNPMNSWDRMDSEIVPVYDHGDPVGEQFVCGDNDHDLMMKLSKGGSVHAKYRRFITVTCDITAPLYWWKEADQSKVGTVTNSTSTMHKIHAKKFTLEDFSHERLNDWNLGALVGIINALNDAREQYLFMKQKDEWYQMIQLLPSSYNQKRTMILNYEVLAAWYRDRRHHKLDEWHVVCDWIKSLPYSEVITGE